MADFCLMSKLFSALESRLQPFSWPFSAISLQALSFAQLSSERLMLRAF
ncbi:MAG TPA: hypothetical protein PK706_10360 [Xanthobacteraceae bacterium]|nr:hypothetical protein [Xanthobacteraceae bacterium]